MSIRIVIADDQVLFAESLRSLLETRSSDFKVIEIVHDGEHAVDAAVRHRPDIVLMDVRMPRTDGVEATRRIREVLPDQKVAMLTTYDHDNYVKAAITYGASGYILKDTPANELCNAIRAICGGAFLTTGSVAESLRGHEYEVPAGNRTNGSEVPDWYYELTRRERHILRLVIEGFDNTDISKEVCLASQTVRNYLSRIYDKLEVHRRSEAIRKCKDYRLFL